jgi:hypothetical protein
MVAALVLGCLGWLYFALCLAVIQRMLFEPTGNAYADELAGNGLLSLAAAARSNKLDYDRFYPTVAQQDADRILMELDAGGCRSRACNR